MLKFSIYYKLAKVEAPTSGNGAELIRVHYHMEIKQL